MSAFTRKTASQISSARTGVLHTAHGDLPTPFFMPIATKGAVKTLSSVDIERLGSPILLSNTYHLYLRPGLEVLSQMGGLHKLMSWNGAILTDSGGYQVFSLSGMRKITEEGVAFQSHIDGSKHVLTPELSMKIQETIGSDIQMVFDECTPAGSTTDYLEKSLARTTRWAQRCKDAHTDGSLLFGIVQGGTDVAMRARHAQDLMSIGFDGYAIGGLSVGEPFDLACEAVQATTEVLPEDRARYFMGGAQPHEIVAYVKRGIDMLDCVLPTRNARHGLLYRFTHGDVTKDGFYETIHMTNEQWKNSDVRLASPDEHDSVSLELSRYSYAYIRHLFSVDEVLAARLLTLANVKFYLDLMKKIREAIDAGTF